MSGQEGLRRSDGAWEMVDGFDGFYRHTTHPEWEVRAIEVNVADGPVRFELRNTRTGHVVPSDITSLYPMLDIAHAYITAQHQRQEPWT